MPALFLSPLKRLTFQLLLAGFFVLSVAAEPSPSPAPTPTATATPEKKLNFFQRIFHKKIQPTPTPTPVASPSVTPRVRKKKPKPTSADSDSTSAATPDSDAEATPREALKGAAASTKKADASAPVMGDSQMPASLPPLGDTAAVPPAAQVSQTPEPADTPDSSAAPVISTNAQPVSAEVRNNPLNQPIPLLSEASGSQTIKVPSPEEVMEKEMVDRIEFRKAKMKALEDPKVDALRQKSELAASPDERYSALKAYYPKLFAAMRKSNPDLSVQIDEMEAASRRRLERIGEDAQETAKSAK